VVTLACEGADCAATRSGVVSISNAARSSGPSWRASEAQEPPKTAGSAWGRADRLWRCSSGQAEEEAALQSTGGKEQQR
jgi:hypothetical protein